MGPHKYFVFPLLVRKYFANCEHSKKFSPFNFSIVIYNAGLFRVTNLVWDEETSKGIFSKTFDMVKEDKTKKGIKKLMAMKSKNKKFNLGNEG